MKFIIENWRIFMKESKDSKEVSKILLFDEEDKVLFLKRTKYTKKFAGKWDIPGGHIHIDESHEEGLVREVKEETNLTVKNYEKVKKIDNITYFKGKLPKGKIKLSKEHSDFKLRDVKNIKNPNKFEKIAQEILENE